MDRALKLVDSLRPAMDGAAATAPLLKLEGHVGEQALRIAEALLFASGAPVGVDVLAASLPRAVSVADVMAKLAERYEGRGIELARVAGGYTFRTAADLGFLVAADKPEPRKLGRAALEILAIIAYHQPVTRAEIEDIRGVATSRGSLDLLLECGFIRMRGRRRTPGRPVTYGTTPTFLSHFGIDRIEDLPGIEELKGAGFIDGGMGAPFAIPSPSDEASLMNDEDALEPDFFDTAAEVRRGEDEDALDPGDDAGSL